MRNQRKQESAREKNKKNSARFLANERYSYHFWEAERPPPIPDHFIFRTKGKRSKNRSLAHSSPPSRKQTGNGAEMKRIFH